MLKRLSDNNAYVRNGHLSLAWLILLLFCLLTFNPVSAQPSLPAGNSFALFDMEQSGDAFLWVATNDGLFCFKGENQEVFKNNTADIWSVSENNITALYRDSKGRLWAGTAHHGLNLYSPGHHGFYHLNKVRSLQDTIDTGVISTITEDEKGNIWVISANRNVDWFQLPNDLPDHPDLNTTVKWVGHCAEAECLELFKKSHFRQEYAAPVNSVAGWKNWRIYLCFLMITVVLSLFLYQLHRHRLLLKAELQFEKDKSSRLIAIEEFKKQFLTHVVYEVRSPVSLILESVRQFMEQKMDRASKDKLQVVEKNSLRLLAMINQLLDQNAIDNGRAEPLFRKAGLAEIIRPVYQSFFIPAHAKSLKMHFKNDNALSDFYFDQDMVEKMVAHLLSNAVKYSKNNGLVELRIALSETLLPAGDHIHQRWAVVTVKDTGPGMTKDRLSEIINPPVDALRNISSTWASGGLGIGLTQVKEYARLHNGKLVAESVLGEGSTFAVWLPFQTEKRPDKSEPDIVAYDANTLVQPIAEHRYSDLVLVIENDDEMLTFIKDMLQNKGYQVLIAGNGDEGLEKIFKFNPDLVITDLRIPGKDGNNIIKAVREHPMASQIPIIVLTAKVDLDSKVESLKHGADVYLTKPFYTEELLAHTQRLLKRKQHKVIPDNQQNNTDDLQQDDRFLQDLQLVIEQYLGEEGLGVQQIAEAMQINRTQLYRKVKKLTGQSVLEFIRNYRLDRARHLLRQKERSVNEVARQTGFSSSKHFARVFKERFGLSPGSIKPGI